MPLVAGIDSSTQSVKVVVRDADSGALVRQAAWVLMGELPQWRPRQPGRPLRLEPMPEQHVRAAYGEAGERAYPSSRA